MIPYRHPNKRLQFRAGGGQFRPTTLADIGLGCCDKCGAIFSPYTDDLRDVPLLDPAVVNERKRTCGPCLGLCEPPPPLPPSPASIRIALVGRGRRRKPATPDQLEALRTFHERARQACGAHGPRWGVEVHKAYVAATALDTNRFPAIREVDPSGNICLLSPSQSPGGAAEAVRILVEAADAALATIEEKQ